MIDNTQPSAETVAYVGEVLKLASYLDDRVGQPDKGRLRAWSKQIEKYKFTRDDMLNGLEMFYDASSSHAIGIGDLIQYARTARRDRIAKEEEVSRAQREARNDAKAEDEIRAVSADVLSDHASDTPRLRAARDGLLTCQGKRECRAAILEFAAAKAEAAKPQHLRRAS